MSDTFPGCNRRRQIAPLYDEARIALADSLEIFCMEPEPEHPSFHDLWIEDLNRQIDAAFSAAGYTETT